MSWPVTAAGALMRRFSRLGWDVILVSEEGWLRGGLKRRVLRCRLRKRVGAEVTETEDSSTLAQADRRETQRMKETK